MNGSNTLKRKNNINNARQVSMYFIRELLSISLAKTGESFAGKNGKGKDHSTIISGIKSVENNIDVYPKYREEIENIRTEILHYAKRLEISLPLIINEKWYTDTIWGENDFYPVIFKLIRKRIYFLKYHFRIPNPYLNMESGITVNGYSGYREHSF